MSHPAAKDPIVFVVDDDEAICRSVAELVRSFGHQARTYVSPREFLNSMESLPDDQVGCAVFGLRLPGMDGLELHQRITERALALPSIVITAYADTASTVKCMRSGVVAVLDKPFRENELWSFVQEAMANSEQEALRKAYHRELERRLRRLSPQDRQVLQLVLEGSKNRTMAKRLDVSLRTVENRRRRVFDVMQAESVAQLTRMVVEYEHRLPPSAASDVDWMSLPFERVAG